MLNNIHNNQNIRSWVNNVKQLLANLGLNYVWLNQEIENIDLFLSVLKQRIKDCYTQTWNDQVNASSRSTFYNSHLLTSKIT